ncbi:MAG: SAM-dependent methyltransferase [Thermoleophilaceae bacterium]
MRLGRRPRGEGTPEVDPRWYETFFEGDWLTLAVDHDAELTLAEVRFILEKLEPPAGGRVLDLACGHGRHAIELAAEGFRVTGLDISEPALAVARKHAAARGAELELLALDMRELDREGAFDAVYNVSSAFGYHPDEQEDLAVLEGVARALVPGGRFLIDTMNGLWLARNFEPRARRKLNDGTVVSEQRHFDAVAGRSSATWRLRRPDGSTNELQHSMRIYTCPELHSLLRQAGLEPDGVWGGVDGSPYGLDRRRMIVRARRPTAQAR